MSSHDGQLQRTPHPTSLYDILDLTLDKGLVVDVYARASVLGIELLAVDARIVVASVDTYLRFAEAVNRLDLDQTGGRRLPDIVTDMVEQTYEAAARSTTKDALDSVKETVQETVEDAKATIKRVLLPGDESSS